MYIRDLHVQNLKLLRDFRLSFVRDDGSLRMWTVIIGRNATGKTSLLYALGLAAAGSSQASALARPVIAHLRDRRSDRTMEIMAEFCFPDIASGQHELFPGLTELPPTGSPRLRSRVSLHPGETNLEATSAFAGESNGNPLDRARSRNLKLWFVAGYGVSRLLPEASHRPDLVQPSIDRLKPLFGHPGALTSLAFANYFDQDPSKTRMFSRVLKAVLFHPQIRLDRRSGRSHHPGGRR